MVGVDPVANLDDGEALCSHVDDVPRLAVDLDAVADFERSPQQDVTPTGEIAEHIRQGDGDAGGCQPDPGTEVANAEPDKGDAQQDDHGPGVTGELLCPIPDLRVVDPASDQAQDDEAGDKSRGHYGNGHVEPGVPIFGPGEEIAHVE